MRRVDVTHLRNDHKYNMIIVINIYRLYNIARFIARLTIDCMSTRTEISQSNLSQSSENILLVNKCEEQKLVCVLVAATSASSPNNLVSYV